MKHLRAVLRANNQGSYSLTSVKDISNNGVVADEWNTITNALRLMSVSEIFRWDEGRWDVARWG